MFKIKHLKLLSQCHSFFLFILYNNAVCVANKLFVKGINKQMKTYDSTIEQQYHQQHPHLERQLDYLPTTFSDASGIAFTAKADFHDTITETYIEVKNHQLNNYKTKQDCLSRQQVLRQRRGGYLTKLEQLDTGWNHSLYKQLIVQQTLALLDIKYLVVFYKPTKLSKQAINKMNALGLNYTIAE